MGYGGTGYPPSGTAVITAFSDTMTRANITGLGPNYVDGGGALGNNVGAWSPGISANKASTLSSLNTAAAFIVIPYIFQPLDVIKTVRADQFAQVKAVQQTAVGGVAIESGIAVLAGWQTNGTYIAYMLNSWTKGVAGQQSYRLVRHNGGVRTDLVLGPDGDWLLNSVARLEARITVGVSVELRVLIDGVLKATFVDNTASRSQQGAPGLGRSGYLGNGPAIDSQFINFSCGKL